ncbi:E5 [Oryctolagus cuniculus papillomavirus 1]|uniref:E5 n=1 Tax=Oryctolagus cuniculus papillomavirus 1 TaxID=2772507 RepID=Q9J026_9PAPI|nr:E5 [Oryctolagus cuniculus papillomavirus 1]AAF67127.1 E5 [Oryctolagus cuniculus papillomavirus 1]
MHFCELSVSVKFVHCLQWCYARASAELLHKTFILHAKYLTHVPQTLLINMKIKQWLTRFYSMGVLECTLGVWE